MASSIAPAVIPGVISQRVYPEVGDIDDCWVIATIWGAVASVPTIWRPTTTTFRRYAGVPDLPGSTGGNIDDAFKGAQGCWPSLDTTKWKSVSWSSTRALLKAHPASVALDSAWLPANLRFNYLGKHQSGTMYDAAHDQFFLANPLAPDHSRPLPISETQLKIAMSHLVSSGEYRAILFPAPKTGPWWARDIAQNIRDEFTALQVAAKLRQLGITTYGDAINYTDMEAGLRARRINYGTSVQLIDVRALMRPGT